MDKEIKDSFDKIVANFLPKMLVDPQPPFILLLGLKDHGHIHYAPCMGLVEEIAFKMRHKVLYDLGQLLSKSKDLQDKICSAVVASDMWYLEAKMPADGKLSDVIESEIPSQSANRQEALSFSIITREGHALYHLVKYVRVGNKKMPFEPKIMDKSEDKLLGSFWNGFHGRPF